jgi:hypothetical protein
VVVSLVERPAAQGADTSIAAHALVSSVQAATPQSAPQTTPASPIGKPRLTQASATAPTAQPKPAMANELPPPVAAGPVPNPAASAPSTTAALPVPAGVAGLETPLPPEAAPTPSPDEAIVEPDAGPAKKAAAKRHRTTSDDAFRRWQGNGDARRKWSRDNDGLAPLIRRLFSSRASSSYSPN